MAVLDAGWQDTKTAIIQFVAFGGMGKSALIAHWLKALAARNWDGAEAVFGYSFFSQGSQDETRASGDSFLTSALVFLGTQIRSGERLGIGANGSRI